jgi:hypothetical protein
VMYVRDGMFVRVIVDCGASVLICGWPGFCVLG